VEALREIRHSFPLLPLDPNVRVIKRRRRVRILYRNTCKIENSPVLPRTAVKRLSARVRRKQRLKLETLRY